MLFLAVFCGFLAEYQLEHKIEKERVKKYMHDMVESLKYDTTRISRNVNENKIVHSELDSFRFEIKEAINGRPNTNRLYYYYLKINQYGIAAFNKSVITQLKNSGSLRLVKSDSLLNEMLDYYERKVFGSETFQQHAQKSLEALSERAIGVFSTQSFNFVASATDSTFSKAIDETDNSNYSSVINDKSLKLLSSDPKELEMLNTAALRFEWSLIYYNRFLNYTRNGANKLMMRIREVY
jgi:hypothetical protein